MESENTAGNPQAPQGFGLKPIPNILPTVGRVVYYKSRGSADGVYPPTNFASIITNVHSEDTVDLVTFSPSGIRFEQNVAQGEAGGQWDWMPFQKAQQARLK